MNKRSIIGIIIIVAFYAIIYIWSKEEKSIAQHPAIHSAASKPDNYLLEAKDYEGSHLHARSAYRIEQAIQAIWKLEKDMDDQSFERLEQTIGKLEAAHRRIVRDSISYDELLKVLEFSLGNLAHAELEVAEKYSVSNQTIEARTALKYAQLHIKNALILHNPSLEEDSVLSYSETLILSEMDSLLKSSDLSNPEYTASLDKLIEEVDEVIQRIEEK